MNENTCISRRQALKATGGVIGSTTLLTQTAAGEETENPPIKGKDRELRYYQANPEQGFYHGYYLATPGYISLPRDEYRPLGMQHPKPPLNVFGGMVHQDHTSDGERDHPISDVKEKAKDLIESGGLFGESNDLAIPLLIPVFETPSIDKYPGYLPSLNHGAMQVTDDKFERLDLQLLNMITHAKEKLNANDEKLVSEDGVIMNTFSASSMFSNRFALMHPSEVAGLTLGGAAVRTIPADNWNGHPLPYPLGTAGLESMIDGDLDIEAYKSIPKLMYLNEGDEKNFVKFDNFFEYPDDVLREIYPETSPSKQWETTQQIQNELNNNVTFTTYAGGSHNDITDENLDDIPEFYIENDLLISGRQRFENGRQDEYTFSLMDLFEKLLNLL